MEWEDGRIIHLRNEERKKRYSDLSTGMYVKEQFVRFQKYRMDEMEFNIILPLDVSPMSQENVNRKYPSLDRPDLVVGNEAGDVAFAFSNLQDHIADDGLRRDTIGVLRTLISSANPSIDFFDEGSVRNSDMSCCWFDFKSYVITGSIYILQLLFHLKTAQF